MRIWAIRVAALAILLLLALLAALGSRTLSRLPDTVVYFVTTTDGTDFTLERSYRRTGRGGPEDHVRSAIEELVEGPTRAEEDRGLATALPPGLEVRDVELIDGVAVVDLSREFESGGGTALMRARLNQVFYTVTQPGSIEGVALSIDGRPLEVFGGEGLLVERPWYRSEHPDLPVW